MKEEENEDMVFAKGLGRECFVTLQHVELKN